MSSGIEVRDSMDDDPSTLPVVDLPCPRCSRPIPIDTAEVVRSGLMTGLDPDIGVEPWRTLVSAGVVERKEWGRSFTLVDGADLAPRAQVVSCGTCLQSSWAVVGWGEFQPARYRCTVWPLVGPLG